MWQCLYVRVPSESDILDVKGTVRQREKKFCHYLLAPILMGKVRWSFG